MINKNKFPIQIIFPLALLLKSQQPCCLPSARLTFHYAGGVFGCSPFIPPPSSIVLSLISRFLHCLEFFFPRLPLLPFLLFFSLFFFSLLLFFISHLLPLSYQFMPGEYHQVHLLINSNACLPETLGCNCMSPHKAASIQDVLSSNVSHPMNHKSLAFSWHRH